MVREIGIGKGVLTRVLQRAEYIEENERIANIEEDAETGIITLYLEERR